MPELPEVETTRRGIEPLLRGRRVSGLTLRAAGLRRPFATDLADRLTGRRLRAVRRRAKYLLFDFAHGSLLLHLGMSGSLRVVDSEAPAGRHDHVDIDFSGRILRMTDPRKFGVLLWAGTDVDSHPLLRYLGPEPLSDAFDGAYLLGRCRKRRTAIKALLMDQKVVVGVGNIYASEALFRAGIRPDRPCGRLSAAECDRLVAAVRDVLTRAIAAGGTTLRDFQRADGRPGYFSLELQVYGRGGEPCVACGQELEQMRLAGRSTFFCRYCQH
ncbi:DNA-(apurinic or apyrimidinic site) lyase [Geothermobacter ehrlichii]|uniref:Formamidopyrimidine-DNA glycosylase n=1 Tax=Geothermobacter ehrlichii TaxID=213224 RepID=A0A5D3WM81_9BACT|nr:bifunctional DNA-formamidopyrimidine glycosylase/DNA-(apurinic or apyrimidinic site) lyase [Geothermobacter ehrlichii]TYO99589.1 DNA-(apurinic or apyrimidinic site) lyase [Geothermobacter ehrlichii]